MTATIRDQILDAVATVLGTLSVAGLKVQRGRDEPVDSYPFLALYAGGQSVLEDNAGHTLYAMEAYLDGTASGASSAAAERAAHELYGQSVLALWVDRTLGGLAIDIAEGELLMTNETGASVSVAGFRLVLRVQYWTLQGDPYHVS